MNKDTYFEGAFGILDKSKFQRATDAPKQLNNFRLGFQKKEKVIG